MKMIDFCCCSILVQMHMIIKVVELSTWFCTVNQWPFLVYYIYTEKLHVENKYTIFVFESASTR